MIIIHDIDYFIIKSPPVAFLGTVKTENSIILIIRVIEFYDYMFSKKKWITLRRMSYQKMPPRNDLLRGVKFKPVNETSSTL
jgi:hypothetical protein